MIIFARTALIGSDWVQNVQIQVVEGIILYSAESRGFVESCQSFQKLRRESPLANADVRLATQTRFWPLDCRQAKKLRAER